MRCLEVDIGADRRDLSLEVALISDVVHPHRLGDARRLIEVAQVRPEVVVLVKVLLIALDDTHLLAEPNELFNDLSRARQRSGVSVEVGLILIANDASFLDELSSDTASTLKPKSIPFPSYKADELYEIIQQRSQKAFHEDTIPENVLQLCAARCAGKGGHARYAIDLLKEAGE